MPQLPAQISQLETHRKPESLPSSARKVTLLPETITFLNSLKVFEVDGESLYDDEFPKSDRFYILWDFTTNIAWLADSSGFSYPRYVMNIYPWVPEDLLNQPENMPESKFLEMTSSMSMGTAPMAPAKKKRKPQPKENGIIKLTQSADMIGNLLAESELENLEKNKFEVVCLDASGREISTKSFASEEAAQDHIEKQSDKLDDDEVGCSYEIRVVGKEHKDPFAMKESGQESKLQEFRGTGKHNFEVPERRYRRDIEVGDKVKGIMGVHGHSSGTVTKIGSPYSSSGSPTIYVKSEDGKEWDTFGFNLSLQESKLHECDHGDIVRLTGYLKRPGYYKVDTQDAMGASAERPWVEDLETNTGFYIDPSDVDDMEVIISASEYDTRMVNTPEDVEDILEYGSEDED
jgi:hypothetical protein